MLTVKLECKFFTMHAPTDFIQCNSNTPFCKWYISSKIASLLKKWLKLCYLCRI